MLDFSRQGNKNIGNNRAKRRDVAKEKGEENKKKSPGVCNEAEERKFFGQHRAL